MSRREIEGPILVTGGAGYIGSHVCYALLDLGVEVVVLDNLSTGHRFLLPESIPFIDGNAGDTRLLRNIFSNYSIKGVMHFAGSIVVPESLEDPISYYQNNTIVSMSLISECITAGIDNFLFSSTGTVYAQSDGKSLDENAPVGPITPYSRSKLMTEWILENVSRSSGLCYTILRYFNVAGADPSGRTGQCGREATHLIKVASEVASGKRSSMEIFGVDYNTPDGTCIRDYIHVSDVATAHLEVMGLIQSTRESLVLNCGNGRGYSVKEVITEYELVTGITLNAIISPRRAGDVAKLISDPTRLKTLTGWTPKRSKLKDIIASSLAWESKVNDLIPEK